MRIALLVDPKTAVPARALRDAHDLAARGHRVTVLATADAPELAATAGPPEVRPCRSPDQVPEADLLLATSAASVELAVAARRGTVARYLTEAEPEPGRPVPCIVPTGVTRLPGAAAGEVHEVARSLDRAAFFPVERPQSPGAELRIGALGSARHGGDALRTALREFGVDAAIVELDGPFDALDERGRGALLRGLDLLAVLEVGARAAFVPAVPEALACGLPCVLADGPATRASVGGRSDAALFVEPGDARDLAEAIVFVARNQRLRDQLRRAAVEAAAAHTAARHADELEQAVRRIAARARGPGRAEAARPPADAGDGADLVHALALRAQRHVECGDLAAATACVEAAIEAVPASPLLWVQLAEIRAQSGDAVGALDATEHALEAGNSSCRLHELRARVLEQLARPSDALAALAQASRSEDAPAEVFRALARRLRQRGAVEAASQAEREAAVRAACG